MVTQVIVIRHGQTQWNRDEKFRGRVEVDLDELGIKQAEATAERVTEFPVAAVYCSPLKRASSTASIIARKLKLEAQPLPAIIDIDFGKWQGLSPKEVAQKYSSDFDLWLHRPHLLKFPGGESLEEVRQRAATAVDGLVNQYPDKTIVLVTHRVVTQILILHFLKVDNSRFWQIVQDVCCLNIFEVKDGMSYARLLNDTCHLKKNGLI
jgi:broad specificity phosphatase PhoE